MADQQTEAASSPAEVADPFNGENPTLEEYTQYRKDGELPARFKPESESATDDTQEETEETEAEEPKPEPESDPEESQEQPETRADKRIKQLLAKTKELERKLTEKQDVKPAEPSPVQQAPGEPTPEEKNADGTPKFKTYEEYTKALARWEIRQELAEQAKQQRELEAQNALRSKLDNARARYDDADDVIFPTNQAIQNAPIPLGIKEVIAQSKDFVELLYVLGGDPDTLNKFISLAQRDPEAALDQIFEYKRGIREELSKDVKRDAQGKFVPEGNKTKAPKPPSPVGGTSTRAFDMNDETLSNEEWMRKRNADVAKKRGY